MTPTIATADECEDRAEAAYAFLDLALDLGYSLEECWFGVGKYGFVDSPPTIDALAALPPEYLTQGDEFQGVAWPSAILADDPARSLEFEVQLIDGTRFIYGGTDGDSRSYIRPIECHLCGAHDGGGGGLCEGIGGRQMLCECVGWIEGEPPAF